MSPTPRKRRRTLLKALAATISLAALLLLVRLSWGYYAYARFQSTIAELRAKGIPLLSTDFPDASLILPSQNAVTPLLTIESRFTPSRSQEYLVASLYRELGTRSALTPAEHTTLSTLKSTIAPLLADLDAAAARPTVCWPRSYIATNAATAYALNTQSALMLKLMRSLHALAFAAHDSGDDAQAFHHLAQLTTLCRVVSHCPQIIASFTITDGSAAIAQDVETFQATANFNDPAVAAEAYALLSALKQWIPPTTASTKLNEAVLIDTIAQADKESHRSGWFLAPISYQKTSRHLINVAACIPQSTQLNFPAFQAATPPTLLPTALENTLLPDINIIICPTPTNYDRFAKLAGLRAASLLLAARLHALSHGNLPTSAAALVPTLLNELPLDPFSPTPRPFQYRLDPAGPTVWSIGPDGIDDACITLSYSVRRPTPRNDQPDIAFGAAWITARSRR